MLEAEGFTVVGGAADGAAALAAVQRLRPEVVLLDVQLPGVDGFAVAEQLAPGVPVIIVTGDPVGAYARVQGRVEQFQVLPKPVAAELLEHAVTAAV